MTRGSSSSDLLKFDPKIDRTFHRKLKSSAQAVIKSLTFKEQSVSEDDNICVENSEELESRVAKATMGDQRRTMVEYTRPTLDSTGSCIVRPAIEANNFEVKASTMNMIYNQC